MDERELQRLIDKLKTLPPQRLAEVDTFVDFMRAGGEGARDRAMERLGNSMTKLEPSWDYRR